jgi:hypothetical protein
MRAARDAGEPGTGGEKKTALPLLEFRMHSHTEMNLSTFLSRIATSVTSGTASVEELTGGSLWWSSGTTSIVTVKLSSVTVEGVTAEKVASVETLLRYPESSPRLSSIKTFE